MSNNLGINLVKDQNVELRGLRKIIIALKTFKALILWKWSICLVTNESGCGWDPDRDDSPYQFDLDVACFLLDQNRKMQSKDNFIYFGNLRYGDSVTHVGDNLTGDGDGDDERIFIFLDQLPEWVSVIPIVVSIYQGQKRNQNFGMMKNSYVRIIDITHERNLGIHGPLYNSTSYPNQQFCKYQLISNFNRSTGCVFGELRKQGGEWTFEAVGAECSGFDELINRFQPDQRNSSTRVSNGAVSAKPVDSIAAVILIGVLLFILYFFS